MKLAIVGAGEIGQALAGQARHKKHEVLFWDAIPEKCSAPTLREVVVDAEAILFAVPSSVLEKTIMEVANLVSKETPLFLITKGLEPVTGETPAEILERLKRPGLFLGGPLLAEEIVSGAGGFMAAAGPDRLWLLAEQFFEWGNLRVRGEPDIFGAAAAGVLKNFYAFLMGVAAGSGLGENIQSGILSAAVSELAKALPRFGGQPETAWGPAGIGDLHATAFSPYSRNRAAGVAFVKDGRLDERAESVKTWPILKRRLSKMEDFPLLRLIGAIMEGREEVNKIKDVLDPNRI